MSDVRRCEKMSDVRGCEKISHVRRSFICRSIYTSFFLKNPSLRRSREKNDFNKMEELRRKDEHPLNTTLSPLSIHCNRVAPALCFEVIRSIQREDLPIFRILLGALSTNSCPFGFCFVLYDIEKRYKEILRNICSGTLEGWPE